jgi:5-methylcytosine-specific restriction endonuclease McrBC regulatory subunit McrC
VESTRNGKHSVTVLDAVGALAIPGMTLIVKPKIPEHHFNYIATRGFSSEGRFSNGSLNLDKGIAFQDAVHIWFLQELECVVSFGLSRDYVQRNDEIQFVRGSVNQLETALNFARGVLAIDCRFDEFETDHPLNRVLKGALRAVIARGSSDSTMQLRAARLDRLMREISLPTPSDIASPVRNLRPMDENVFYLATEVLRSHGRSLSGGASSSKSFLYKTPLFIERGLRQILNEGLSPIKVSNDGRVLLPTSLRVNPDLTIARPPFTADVKYKKVKDGWIRQDLAQAVFFAAAYKSPIAAVLSFGLSDVFLPEVPVGSIRVRSVLWRTDIEPEQAAQRIVDEFLEWVPEDERLIV